MFDVLDRIFGQGGEAGLDPDSAIAACRANNAKVCQVIHADRLLVFNPAEGWEPLCRFLGVVVPAAQFPQSNVRSEFWELFGRDPANV